MTTTTQSVDDAANVPKNHWRRGAIVTVPLALVLALTLWRAEGPAPRDASAPENTFSAARAMGTLRELLAEGVPHPVGTPANARIRERIESRFRALGYETSIQRRFACNSDAECGLVENIIARKPGPPAGNGLLLAAHYDSVAAGPGASDNGMGVATLLEIARAIRNENPRNRVTFLVTDGEEAGLLGAEAFAADEALMRDVAAVINVEMRGTRGASNMFETSRGNRVLIRHLATALERPQASSFYFAIYSLLTNDTDVTVFKGAGKAAINFAAVRGVNWYHTPFDDLAHASPRTLQHHGDNMLATLRELAGADLAARGTTDATYFDLLGFFLVWWPQEWTLWIAVASLILLIVAARKASLRPIAFGVLAALVAIVLAVAGGVAMSMLVRFRSMEINWVAHPLAGILALALTGLAAAFFAAAFFNRRADARGLLYGTALVWHALGIALALALPGAAYLMIVPALAVTVCALARADATTTSAVAATVAAILIFPILIVIYDALGGSLMAAIALVAAIFATLAVPPFARARNGLAAIALAIVCAVIAIALPAVTPEKPRAIPLYYIDDPAAKTPRWLTWTLTDRLREAAPFAAADMSLTPWNLGTGWSAPAPAIGLRRVTLTGERNGNHVRLRVTSHRNAGRVLLLIRGGSILRTNGVAPSSRSIRVPTVLPNGWKLTTGNGVQELVVDVEAQGRVEAVATDIAFEFPAAGAALVRARQASIASTVQDGDVTITRARGTF